MSQSQTTTQTPFTLFDSQVYPLDMLLNHLLGNTSGIEINTASLNYIGAEEAVSFFDSLDLGNGLSMNHSGILLTTGDGAPPRYNSEPSYSVDYSMGEWVEYDEPLNESIDVNGTKITDEWIEEGYWESLSNTGDAQLSELAKQSFSGAGTTYDAAVLEFSFKVTDDSVRSISLDLIFGSEEYPNYIDSSYVDIAAVIVNDENYAYIDGEVSKPLSIVGATTEDGRFIDNHAGLFYEEALELEGKPSPYSIEYNGITPKLTISIPLEDEQDTYHVRIGIADTGDAILDSGLFVSNVQTLTSSYEGTLVNVEADDKGSILAPAASDTATKFVGGAGNDTMSGSSAPDVYDLQKGGANTIKSSMANLNKDTVVGFSEQDTLTVEDGNFTTDQMFVTMGSAILDIDSNSDGTRDGTITLEGDYRQGVFVAEGTEADGINVRFKALDLTPDQTLWVTSAEELTVSADGVTKLLGNTAGKSITVEAGNSVTNVSAGTNITLNGVTRDEVQLLRDGTTLIVLDLQGNALVQLAASTDEALVSTLTLEDETFQLMGEANQAQLAMGRDGSTLPPLYFEDDGDRLTGAQWAEAFAGEEQTAMLTGVQADDATQF